MRGAVKSLALVIVAGFALALGIAAPAGASTPCSQAVINDWFDNGKVDKTYPKHCYTDAINHLPRDVDTYSSAKEDIQRALLAVLRGNSNGNGSGNGSGGTSGQGSSQVRTQPERGPSGVKEPTSAEKPGKGVILRAVEWLGPSEAASVPLPLLILASVAFLLLAAAGGTLVTRRLQERRLPPPPQA